MKYTGWLVNPDGSLGTVFDSNHNTEKTFRFKTGRGKVIKGWESGMLGMQKGGKRFLIIPPHLAYGQKSVGSRVPPNSTLAFEVDLLRVKQSKDSSSVKSGGSVESLPQAVASETPPPSNPVTVPSQDLPPVSSTPANSDDTDDVVKGRTASLTDQISHLSNDPSKNPILSRVARMGHAMLPVPTSTPVEVAPDQSQIVVQNQQPIPTQQPPAVNPHPEYARPLQPATPPQHPQHAPHQQQIPSQPPVQHQPPQLQSQQPQYQSPAHQYHPQQHLPSQNVMAGNLSSLPYHPTTSQSYMDQSMMSSYNPPTSDPSSLYNNYPGYRQMSPYQSPHGYGSDFMPVLVSESRQQNSELRLLQEKVDKVSSLVEEVKKNTSESSLMQNKSSSSQPMDPVTIMRNIQRIMEENENLKQTITDKDKQISSQSEKISDLLQQNQKHVEKSNLMLEQRNDSFKESFNHSQARSLQLEQDKVDLTERLSDATSKVSDLTLEVSNAKQRESELKQKFKEIYMQEKERAEEAEERVKELEDELSSATEKAKDFASSDEAYTLKINKLNQQISNLNEVIEKENKEHSDELASFAAEKLEFESKLNQTEVDCANRIEEIQSNAMRVDNASAEQKAIVASLEMKLKEALAKSEAESKQLDLVQHRYTQARNAYENQNEKLQEALGEIEELETYKQNYNQLLSKATLAKEKYEERVLQLREQLKQQTKTTEPGSNPAQLVDEVKKIMNSIFQRVRARISSDEEYSGANVLKIMLEIIKSTTLSLLDPNKEKDDEDSDDDSNDDDEDDSSDDDEADSSDDDEGEEESEEGEKESGAEVKKCEEEISVKKQELQRNEEDNNDSKNNSEADGEDSIEEKLTDNPTSTIPDQQKDTSLDGVVEERPETPEPTIENKEDSDVEVVESEEHEIPQSRDQESEGVVCPAEGELQDQNINPEEVLQEEQTSIPDQDIPVITVSKDDAKGDFKDLKDGDDCSKPQADPLDPLTTADPPTMHRDEQTDQEVEKTEPDKMNLSADAGGVEDENALSSAKSDSLSRSSSVLDSREPPPLFDDGSDDDDDLDWLN